MLPAVAGHGNARPPRDRLLAAREDAAGPRLDRPHLRPVLDAVLTALLSLGPVTVEARQALVSLLTPRRTFAVVQATTRTRVDLGQRLADPAPGLRLLPAKNLGAATARIALTGPAEFDDEALGWLRLAYQQNTAPPPPRRKPAPRPKPEPTPLTVVIEGLGLPGRSFCAGPDAPCFENVHLALRSTSKGPVQPGDARTPVAGDRPSARRRSLRPMGGPGHGQAR